ncbi:NrfD/PsrC family molybdoenzyme membrane anchor subunit [Consotaella salsifontis]|uniref:Prokaryotic molybdopterin-containing oxidoreductase family, membrane subunit n=1 Tax=Consotaella salsifontis TaxID=1365950 RepID=A0A1T4PMZ9_9HYPH|nr:NrfD/PsrC family molybdoenzyme membrane anchor subunit [Consotaella salsifontis]SJZ92930.1 prokaryotic molybdopterin-containing oxidoreductase family, membrane subunit [Consotaella salsifontis]
MTARSGRGYTALTESVADPVLSAPAGRSWWLLFSAGLVLTCVFFGSIFWLFYEGIGIFGNNTSVVWAYPIANYVWWIGIGNAGTLISCMLLLTRQKWRSSINRFAEAMTLFAAAIAGIFPILHLGRPLYFYWLVPYPNTMDLWPQWKSPLVWDFFAIASYLIFSLLFWYVGALPDFATFRDRSRSRAGQLIYGALALGWRGSVRHWAAYETFYKTMAALGVPLVVSVHSVVGMDFAAGNMPGWQETIFPPYFVVGAMFSGFAMVVVLAAIVRRFLRTEELVTRHHFEAMAKILLAGSIVMGLSYGTEAFQSWYAGDDVDRTVVAFQYTGTYAWLMWMQIACNVAIPQLLWLPAARRSIPVLLVIAVLINVGMYLERILIIINTLSRGHLPSMWSSYAPTLWDWLLLAGSLGFFLLLFACFLRLAPAISMHEMRKLVFEGGRE